MNLFFKGIILGFSIAAPVGPIGILCIRRTLQFGRLSGFFSGLGAAFADSIYAMIAAFGLTFIADILITGRLWLQFMGGLFLLYLGWKTFYAKINESHLEITHTNLFNDFLSTFFLTLTNPLTVLSFVAVFAGIGLTSTQGNYFESASLVAGVFVGSCSWWLLLSEGVTLFRKKMSQQMMRWLNRIAGILIALFGILALIGLFV